jgi:pyruvate formate lyase activating enzyme
MQIDRELCTGCGACTEACPSGAMEKIGTLWDAPALVYELAKDRAYFEKSGGGVTISGGEVAMQADFAREVLALLKQQGISTAIDTCGQCSWERLAQLLPHTDLVLYDLKEMDAAKHKEFTGVTNELVLGNLGRLFSLKKEGGYQGQIWIRTGYSAQQARDENIVAAARLIQSLPVPPEKWELCAFNNLCRDKYTRLGLVWKYAGTGLLSRAEMEHLRKVAVAAGLPDGLVVWSGTVTEAASEDKVS